MIMENGKKIGSLSSLALALSLALAALPACLTVERQLTEVSHPGDTALQEVQPTQDVAPGQDTQPGQDATPQDVIGQDLPPTDTQGQDLPPSDVTPPDVPPEEVEPACTFSIMSFGTQDGVRYLHLGEKARFVAQVDHVGQAPTVTLDPGQVPSQASWNGDELSFVTVDPLSSGDLSFRTTQVTVTLTVSSAGCTQQRTATVKLLGNVWVAEQGARVVQVFASNGSFLGQGISGAYLGNDAPWSLLELPGPLVAVGKRWISNQKVIEVFNLAGEHQYTFETKDGTGHYLYSVYGAESMFIHQPDGLVWVGGVREHILVHGVDGKFKEDLYLGFQSPEIDSFIQLPDLTVVYSSGSSLDWDLTLLSADGQTEIGGWGDNSNELEFVVDSLALAPPCVPGSDKSCVVAIGDAGWDGSGFVVLLKPNGTMLKHSPPLDFHPANGVVALGDGFLVSIDDQYGDKGPGLALFDKDLNLVTDKWHGPKEGNYKGLMVMGGGF
jgi:hypothetical protein